MNMNHRHLLRAGRSLNSSLFPRSSVVGVLISCFVPRAAAFHPAYSNWYQLRPTQTTAASSRLRSSVTHAPEKMASSSRRSSGCAQDFAFVAAATCVGAAIGWRSAMRRTLRSNGRIGARARHKAVTAGDMRPHVVFLLGGPGSGKGTVADRMILDLDYCHLSAGELLREERRSGSALSKTINDVISSGSLMPSDVLAQLIKKAMHAQGWNAKKFLIDGYPRSVAQLEGWDAVVGDEVSVDMCINLEVGRSVMRQRLLNRGLTSGRDDDNEETIEKRFSTFEAETAPLLACLDARGTLQRIDGESTPDEVWARVRDVFDVRQLA